MVGLCVRLFEFKYYLLHNIIEDNMLLLMICFVSCYQRFKTI
jgi:hypothetical protein